MEFLTAGKSHGEALNGIISDYPSGVDIDISFIDSELKRRQGGFGRGTRMSIEKDRIKIIAGTSNNKSTGSPISFLISNLDYKNWKVKLLKEEKILNPRPGHADLTGYIKYRPDSIRDIIERSSARETAARVAVGAFAKLFLTNLDIFILSYVKKIGTKGINDKDFSLKLNKNFNPVKNKKDKKIIELIEDSPVRCPDKKASNRITGLIEKIREQGDALGGEARVMATGVPAGLGSYNQWYNRLDSKISAAIMSIPSAKAIGIGEGILASGMKSSEFQDEIFYEKNKGFYRTTNNAGGLEGGMTNGENLDIKVIFKPIPTTTKGLKTVNIKNKKSDISLKERSDICAVPSAAVVAESMLAIEIANAIQDKFGRDNLVEIINNYNNYKKYLKGI